MVSRNFDDGLCLSVTEPMASFSGRWLRTSVLSTFPYGTRSATYHRCNQANFGPPTNYLPSLRTKQSCAAAPLDCRGTKQATILHAWSARFHSFPMEVIVPQSRADSSPGVGSIIPTPG